MLARVLSWTGIGAVCLACRAHPTTRLQVAPDPIVEGEHLDDDAWALSPMTWVRCLHSPERDWKYVATTLFDREFLALLARSPRPSHVLPFLVGPRLAPFVDTQAPWCTTTVDDWEGKPVELFAYGVHSYTALADGVQDSFELVVGEQGSYRLVPKGRITMMGPFEGGGSCQLWPGLDGQSGRLVCGSVDPIPAAHARRLAYHQGWSVAPDVAFSLSLTPSASRGEAIRAVLDFPMSEVLQDSAMSEMASEVESLTVYQQLYGGRRDVGVYAELPPWRSLLWLVVEGTGKQEPPPEVFWKLPAKSELALAFTGAQPGQTGNAARGLVRRFVQRLGLPPGSASALADQCSEALLPGGAFVVAGGIDRRRARGALARALQLDPVPYAEAVRAASGWLLFGMPHPFEQRVAAWESLVHAIDSVPGVTRFLRGARVDVSDSDWPVGTASFVLEQVEPSEDRPVPPPPLHVFLARIEQVTWSCLTRDPEVCRDALADVSNGHGISKARLQPLAQVGGTMLGYLPAADVLPLAAEPRLETLQKLQKVFAAQPEHRPVLMVMLRPERLPGGRRAVRLVATPATL